MTQRRRGILMLVAEFLIAAILFLIVVLLHPGQPTPMPEPSPTPTVGPDTGWHIATDGYGTLYCASSTYADSDHSSREAMNRFAHQFPEGDVNGPPCGGNS